MQFYEINICQVMNFRLYVVYNKRRMIKIGNQTRGKSQAFSLMLEWFYCQLYLYFKSNVKNYLTHSKTDCRNMSKKKLLLFFFLLYNIFLRISLFPPKIIKETYLPILQTLNEHSLYHMKKFNNAIWRARAFRFHAAPIFYDSIMIRSSKSSKANF